MKCLACGAEMRLIDVRFEATTPFAIERRIFQCSSCRQTAQRLGFDRSGLPDCTAPAMKTSAPAIRLQSDRSAAGGAPGHAGEMLISRQVAVTRRKNQSIGVRWLARSASPSKSKRRKQGLLPGRRRWKSSVAGRWHRQKQPLRGPLAVSSTASGMVTAWTRHLTQSLRGLN